MTTLSVISGLGRKLIDLGKERNLDVEMHVFFVLFECLWILELAKANAMIIRLKLLCGFNSAHPTYRQLFEGANAMGVFYG